MNLMSSKDEKSGDVPTVTDLLSTSIGTGVGGLKYEDWVGDGFGSTTCTGVLSTIVARSLEFQAVFSTCSGFPCLKSASKTCRAPLMSGNAPEPDITAPASRLRVKEVRLKLIDEMLILTPSITMNLVCRNVTELKYETLAPFKTRNGNGEI